MELSRGASVYCAWEWRSFRMEHPHILPANGALVWSGFTCCLEIELLRGTCGPSPRPLIMKQNNSGPLVVCALLLPLCLRPRLPQILQRLLSSRLQLPVYDSCFRFFLPSADALSSAVPELASFEHASPASRFSTAQLEAFGEQPWPLGILEPPGPFFPCFVCSRCFALWGKMPPSLRRRDGGQCCCTQPWAFLVRCHRCQQKQ